MKLRAVFVLGAALGACFASACPQVAQPSATLARVKSSGTLACGVIQEDAEYSIEDDHGSRGSFDEDLCKAFSIAVIGQKPVLKVVSFLDSASATAALRAGKVDVVASMSADFSHATTPGMRLSRPVLNDGIGFSRSSGGENRSRSRPCRKEGLLPHGNKCGSRFAQLV